MPAPDLFSVEFARDPYPAYRTMRKEQPLFFHEGMQSYILSRHEDVARALKDAAFSTRNYGWQLGPIHGRTIMEKEGKELAAHRSLVQPWFRGRPLQDKLLPRIELIAAEFISAFRSRGEVELISEFTTCFPLSVIVDILGFPRTEWARFHGWHKAILNFLANLKQDPQIRDAGLAARQALHDYVLPLVKQRREHPQDDLLSALCNGEVEGWRLADSEIVGFCGTLLGAGGSTTDKALASLMKNLIEHPEQLAAVRADRSLIDRAFAETLRYSPPLHMILRVTNQDVTVSGGNIPANATVTCLLAAANRDETVFESPDTFDLHRKELHVERSFGGGAEHAAFGLGRHFCVGATLAKVEVRAAVSQLLDAMHDIRFADDTAPPEVGLFSRAPSRLPLRFTSVGA